MVWLTGAVCSYWREIDVSRAKYQDGALLGHDIERCAGHAGTLVQVQQLKYDIEFTPASVASSLRALALHYPLSFTVRSPMVEFQTGSGYPIPLKLNALFSPAIGSARLSFSATVESIGVRVTGYCTASTAQLKEALSIIFINGRLICDKKVHQDIQQVYRDVAKLRGFFCYAAITLPPTALDVNIHPDKSEVSMLSERTILGTLYDAIARCLRGDSAVPRHVRERTAPLTPTPKQRDTRPQAKPILAGSEFVGLLSPAHCVVSYPKVDLPQLYVIDIPHLCWLFFAYRLSIGRTLRQVILRTRLTAAQVAPIYAHCEALQRIGIQDSDSAVCLPEALPGFEPSLRKIHEWLLALLEGDDAVRLSIRLFLPEDNEVHLVIPRVLAAIKASLVPESELTGEWNRCVELLADTSHLLKHFERC